MGWLQKGQILTLFHLNVISHYLNRWHISNSHITHSGLDIFLGNLRFMFNQL